MARKYVTVRLYRHADTDLMALYYNNTSQLPKLMKDALTAFVNGENANIQPPKFNDKILLVRSKVSIHMVLDTDKDTELIDAINMIPAGFRCAFLKNIMRYQMIQGYTDIYFSDALKSKKA